MNETIFLVIMICLLVFGIVFCLPLLLLLGNKQTRRHIYGPNPITLAKMGYFWNEEKQKYKFIDINKQKDNNE